MGGVRAWKEKKHFKERGEQTGGGWNFERSVAGKTMRKEGFGHSGITPRCGEWETGIQKDSERRDMLTASTLLYFL